MIYKRLVIRPSVVAVIAVSLIIHTDG